MLKKMSGIVLLARICMLFLTGCNNKKETAKETKSSETTLTKQSSTSTSKNNNSVKNIESTTSSISSANSESVESSQSSSSAESSSSSTNSSESAPVNNVAPYAVDMTQISNPATFNLRGVNVPPSITLQNNGGTIVTFASRQSNSGDQFAAQVATIPTKEIRVFSNDGSGIRTVKVNTQITLTEHLVGNGMQAQGNMMYLINNKNGRLSLITPNYAGNVDPDQMDVMLEAVQ